MADSLGRDVSIHSRMKNSMSLEAAYEGKNLGKKLRLDLLIENELIIEVKAIERLEAIHTAQLLTYLRLAEKPLGLLLNFNVQAMRQGMKRVVNGL